MKKIGFTISTIIMFMFKSVYRLFYMLLCCLTAMIGYNEINHNLFWSITDWLFMPIVWCKWLIFHEVTLKMIKHCFDFFFQ